MGLDVLLEEVSDDLLSIVVKVVRLGHGGDLLGDVKAALLSPRLYGWRILRS